MFERTSPAVQDYLKAIYQLVADDARGVCATSSLAGLLDVAPASATNMLKKLDVMGLVTHVPYRGAALTDAGRGIALEVIRHHRLIETYLAEALGVPWDRVHDEAEVLEHVLSEDLEERMAAALGYPTMDPHGHPIPPRDGAIGPSGRVAVTDLAAGQSGVVSQVSDRDPGLLRYLGERGLVPGAEVVVVGTEPFEGPITVSVAGREHTLGRYAAKDVLVDVPESRG